MILHGDSLTMLKTLDAESVDCVVTSPPYFALRDYGVAGQLGAEKTPEEFVKNLCKVFDEVKRVLKPTGTCFVNLGDTYFGGGRNKGNKNPKVKSKSVRGITDLGDHVPGSIGPHKSLAQIPSRFAIAMTDRGWLLRNEIIWHKPNAMPSSANDRFTVDFEKVFFFTKKEKYYFEQQFDAYTKPLNRWGGTKLTADGESNWDKGAGQETYRDRSMRPNPKGKNKRTVWSINTTPFSGAHFAVFPEKLIEPMILAGCPVGGTVLDPFFGSGTTGAVAKRLERKWLGIELNLEYIKLAEARINAVPESLFADLSPS